MTSDDPTRPTGTLRPARLPPCDSGCVNEYRLELLLELTSEAASGSRARAATSNSASLAGRFHQFQPVAGKQLVDVLIDAARRRNVAELEILRAPGGRAGYASAESAQRLQLRAEPQDLPFMRSTAASRPSVAISQRRRCAHATAAIANIPTSGLPPRSPLAQSRQHDSESPRCGSDTRTTSSWDLTSASCRFRR